MHLARILHHLLRPCGPLLIAVLWGSPLDGRARAQAEASEARGVAPEETASSSASTGTAAPGGDNFGATASVQGPLAATNREDATASGSTIEVRGRSRALEEVSEALIEVPGVRVTSGGGAGAPTLAALRGAEVGHTAVLLGPIPLTAPDSQAFDLSQLPLSAFDRIEVYRGGAPAFYSEGAIGGVVRFVPETGDSGRVQLVGGAGSFGRRELRATSSVSRSGPLASAFFGHARLLAADNDYEYVDDGQTRFDDSDDRVLRQRNADILQGDLLGNAAVDALGGRVSLLFAGHGRVQGVAGPLASPTLQVRRKLVRGLVGAAYERERYDADGERHHRLQVVVSGSHQVNSLTDLAAELGKSREVDSDDVWQRGFLRAAGGLRVLPFLETSLIATLALDAFRPDNPAAFSVPPRPSDRRTLSLTFEPRLYGRLFGFRSELRPSVRGEWSDSEIRSKTGLEEISQNLVVAAPTYRLAGVIEPLPGLSLSGSVSNGTRIPSVSELFGDRVYQEANVRLQPEKATTADLGMVLRGRFGDLRAAGELRGFFLDIEDLIRFQRTAQYTVRPDNIAKAKILGLELGLSAQCGRHLSLTASLTAMETENTFGNALPLRPPLQVLVRPQALLFPDWLDELTLFTEVHHVSFVYLDDVNDTHLPARTLLAVGLSATSPGGLFTLDARMLNLLDASVTDVLSRPLPGREFRISVSVQEPL